MNTFTTDLDADGILTAALNVPGRSMNTITLEVSADFTALVKRVKGDAAIRGLVLTSGKSNGFCAGADLGEQYGANVGAPLSAEAAIKAELARVSNLQMRLRALETCGKPVAAAINGLALGGGLELLLATHYRVAGDDPRIQLGLPEVTIGLLPGAGATQRVPRLIGIEKALPLLLEGKPIGVIEAQRIGLVDRVVPSGEEVHAAKQWIRDGGVGSQAWDRPDFKIPGGGPYEAPSVMMTATSLMRKNTYGNFPAALNILRCVYEGVLVPIDTGLRIESRYFLLTQNAPQAKAMVRSLFLSMQELKKGVGRPAALPKSDPNKVAILGAGMMGAGIALVSAQVGIDVVLLDRTEEDATRGKAAIEKQLTKAIEKGRSTPEKAKAILARIRPTADYALVSEADIAVEAVFEERAVKAAVTLQAEPRLGPTAVFGSNTSGLPITGLAEQSSRPENFIGMHFFSPVDRMQLVEIIRGKQTSDETLARTIDFVMKLRKTPIVVRDSRGFYTSRTFQTYLEEGFEMLAEGVAPAIIENMGRATGMPRGPLEITDDVGLDLCYAARRQAQADLGKAFRPTAQDGLLRRLVEEQGRFGRKNGKGCYEYPADGPKHLWKDLTNAIPQTLSHASAEEYEDLKLRLLYRQSLEAARIFAEGVISDPRDADVGALLGWGFPAWTGGPLSLIDQVGAAQFVSQCDALAKKCGDRFAPPDQLRQMAARGDGYYSRSTAAR
jgi:3-hydroxyacyl-CoA dehydrogenase / enoyl-CoA hydratase / 3-hydroxybutyryl-CoA epimerase